MNSFVRLLVSAVAMVSLASPAWSGGHEIVERTAKEHANDKPEANEIATTEPKVPVNSRPAIYTSVNDNKIEGWLSWPAGSEPEALPGVIVIHEWWGQNENIKKTAERLAAEGYLTLAVDLYAGETAETPKEAMQLMSTLNKAETEGRDNLQAAYEYLSDAMGLKKVGVVGWCLGGRWSLQASLRMPTNLDATVIYYGNTVSDKEQLDTLQMPILGHFASKDPVVPHEETMAFKAALEELNKDANIYIYPDTNHGFSNPSGLNYNAEQAAIAWERTTGFLAENLQ